MEFKITSVGVLIQSIQAVTKENAYAGIIEAVVDVEKHKNICVFRSEAYDVTISEEQMLREFARTQELPIYVSYPPATNVEESWLKVAATSEIDATIWRNENVDVYRIVEP